jgi:hypothetical protein
MRSGDRDLPLREAESMHRDPDRWLNQLEARLDTVRPVAASSAASDPLGSMSLDAPAGNPAAAPRLEPAPSPVAAPAPAVQIPSERLLSRSTPALPLFHPGGADWDEPLIKVPAAPRAPLSVRRTPDKPRLRTVPKPVRRVLSESDPVLGFGEDSPAVQPQPAASSVAAPARQVVPPEPVSVSGPARRLIAAGIDHLILLSIDAIVVYFTFQIAGLPFSSWQEIPILPLALFLLMVKGSISASSPRGRADGRQNGHRDPRRGGERSRRRADAGPAADRCSAGLIRTVGIGFARCSSPATGGRSTTASRALASSVPLHE